MTSHVVSIPSPPFRAASGAFEVHQVPAAQDNLVWLFVCLKTAAVAAVDGPDAENALAYCQAQGLTLTHVLNTHTHVDHVGLNRDLAQRGMLEGLTVIGPAKVHSQVPGITQPADDIPEVEGSGYGRGDHGDAHRGAFVGAGEVGGAGGVEGVGAGAGADGDASDAGGAGSWGTACSALPVRRRRRRGGVGAVGDADDLGGEALGQGRLQELSSCSPSLRVS